MYGNDVFMSDMLTKKTRKNFDEVLIKTKTTNNETKTKIMKLSRTRSFLKLIFLFVAKDGQSFRK